MKVNNEGAYLTELCGCYTPIKKVSNKSPLADNNVFYNKAIPKFRKRSTIVFTDLNDNAEFNTSLSKYQSETKVNKDLNSNNIGNKMTLIKKRAGLSIERKRWSQMPNNRTPYRYINNKLKKCFKNEVLDHWLEKYRSLKNIELCKLTSDDEKECEERFKLKLREINQRKKVKQLIKKCKHEISKLTKYELKQKVLPIQGSKVHFLNPLKYKPKSIAENTRELHNLLSHAISKDTSSTIELKRIVNNLNKSNNNIKINPDSFIQHANYMKRVNKGFDNMKRRYNQYRLIQEVNDLNLDWKGKIIQIMAKGKLVERQADRSRQLMRIGGFEGDLDIGEYGSDMLLESVKAKVSVLEYN